VILIVLYFNVLHVTVDSIGRYSVPVIPYYLLLGSATLVLLWQRRGAVSTPSLVAAERLDVPVVITSAATGQGLDELRRALLRRVPVAEPLPETAGEDEVAEYQVFRPAARRAFEIERTGVHEFRVTGDAIDRLIARHDLENDEALAHVEHRLRRMGVISALEANGFEPGDDVELGGVVFELDPS
jgi:GTP-binding protein